MLNQLFAAYRAKWEASFGWIVFLLLVLAELLRHPIFNPIIFGSGYYAVYVFTRISHAEDFENRELTKGRMVALGVLLLFSLWALLLLQGDRRAFLSRFDRTCYGTTKFNSEYGHSLCDALQEDIDATLDKESELGDPNE